MKILLTNDDGLFSSGCQHLKAELGKLAEVWVIAPDRERSATSQAFSLRDSLRLHQVQERHYTLNGFPADCVNVALFSRKFPAFDLVVSGINHGVNMGEDIHYSGTVGAARHAAIHRLKAIAISCDIRDKNGNFQAVSQWFRLWLKKNLEEIKPGICYSINYPTTMPIRGIRVSHPGRRCYFDAYRTLEKTDAYEVLLLNETPPGYLTHAGTDFDDFERGYVVLTPYALDSVDGPEFQRWQKIAKDD